MEAQLAPDKGVTISLTVVLAVGMNSWLLTAHSVVWRTAGYIVLSAGTIQEAISQFKSGDFDLVLLDDSISNENKERLTFFIRASGSQTPVASIANGHGDVDWFADATLKNDSGALLIGMGELVAEQARVRRTPTAMRSAAN
jgi:CheY-like chemotaxis protein